MVNEKLITENKKPFETVQELKDEYQVPSFEEFVKSYENDGNVNYADLLSDSDVGVPKRYGPCSNCGRSNHTFKLDFAMWNKMGVGRSKYIFYSVEEALSEATDIVIGQNGWEDGGVLDGKSYSSELRQRSANAIKDAVRIYQLGGSVSGWLEVKENWTEFTTTSNYACGTDRNGKSL